MSCMQFMTVDSTWVLASSYFVVCSHDTASAPLQHFLSNISHILHRHYSERAFFKGRKPAPENEFLEIDLLDL